MSVWRPDSWAMKGFRPWPSILLRVVVLGPLLPFYYAGKFFEWLEEHLP